MSEEEVRKFELKVLPTVGMHRNLIRWRRDDSLEVKSDVLEIILKLVFNLPGEDFVVTVRKVLIQWRNVERDKDIVRYEKNARRMVMDSNDGKL